MTDSKSPTDTSPASSGAAGRTVDPVFALAGSEALRHHEELR